MPNRRSLLGGGVVGGLSLLVSNPIIKNAKVDENGLIVPSSDNKKVSLLTDKPVEPTIPFDVYVDDLHMGSGTGDIIDIHIHGAAHRGIFQSEEFAKLASKGRAKIRIVLISDEILERPPRSYVYSGFPISSASSYHTPPWVLFNADKYKP